MAANLDITDALRLENLKLKIELRKTRLQLLAVSIENFEQRSMETQAELEVLLTELDKVKKPMLTPVEKSS